MPTSGSSFLSSLTKRKKSPEQLVKLAVGCLQELPYVDDENWKVPGVGKAAGPVPPSLEGMTIDENRSMKGDELTTSGQSLASSAGSHTDLPRTSSSESDAAAASASASAVPRRPSFFLSAFSKKESSSSTDAAASHQGTPGSTSEGSDKARPHSRPQSLSVSKFFTDSSKKQCSTVSNVVSPHGLSQSSSLGQ